MSAKRKKATQATRNRVAFQRRVSWLRREYKLLDKAADKHPNAPEAYHLRQAAELMRAAVGNIAQAMWKAS